MISSFDKGAKAKKMARDYKMTSAQIKELISKLNSTFDQKDVAIAAYQNCSDKKNFGIVTESFMSSITKRDVENATINKKD
jgi:FlaG/FlaF family flagellin (archaellin)